MRPNKENIEVYKYGHNKRSCLRHTLVAMREAHKDLSALKLDLRKDYGLTSDARRCQIGNFNINIGVSDESKTYMATTQMEWENIRRH